MYPEWTTDELAAKLSKGEKLNLVDVRELEEWQAGHIAEARLIPLSEFTDRVEELPQGELPIVIICRSGGRSGKACDYLEAQGFPVVNIKGGMLSWDGDVVTGD